MMCVIRASFRLGNELYFRDIFRISWDHGSREQNPAVEKSDVLGHE